MDSEKKDNGHDMEVVEMDALAESVYQLGLRLYALGAMAEPAVKGLASQLRAYRDDTIEVRTNHIRYCVDAFNKKLESFIEKVLLAQEQHEKEKRTLWLPDSCERGGLYDGTGNVRN